MRIARASMWGSASPIASFCAYLQLLLLCTKISMYASVYSVLVYRNQYICIKLEQKGIYLLILARKMQFKLPHLQLHTGFDVWRSSTFLARLQLRVSHFVSPQLKHASNAFTKMYKRSSTFCSFICHLKYTIYCMYELLKARRRWLLS